MTDKPRPLNKLIDTQMAAVDPKDNIWLSASAGTGKTQVLTARVIRLLLEPDVNPENLLCITFTKAGVTEMAERINRLLASWVQMDDAAIALDLEAIGIPCDRQSRQCASQLFAKVLDALGGGLQIMTIHSLCQSLLGSFPEEAGLIPGVAPVEGREQQELYREALSEMILAAEDNGEDWVIAQLQSLSIAMGEEAALKFLIRCASQPDVMAGIPEGEGAEIYARRLAGVNFDGSVEKMLEYECSDGRMPRSSITALAEMNDKWATKTGLDRASELRNWIALSVPERAQKFQNLHYCWSTKSNTLHKVNPKDEAYIPTADELFNWSMKLLNQVKLADYAQRQSKAWLAGKAFSARYAEAKSARGLIDFDDMIRKTAALLNTGGMADWVRYKLDRQIDHILVDESQDTNAAQWEIIKALSNDFFSGISAKGDKTRTIFSVGDYKQAIFGFQGTDPQNYVNAGKVFSDKIAETGGELRNLFLSQSFRSTHPVLDFVNAVIANAGPESFGIDGEIEPHSSKISFSGAVELFKPVAPPDKNVEQASEENEENWLTKEKLILAHRIAGYVKNLIDQAPVLAKTGKPLVAGDIMILLRSRSELAASIVGRLHAAGVQVAGIDRLKLQEPVGVQDILAAIRFVLQPDDDLSLACLLVSPLFGWNQDELLKYGYRKHGITLWRHLRGNVDIEEDVTHLRSILASADFTTPYQFMETILSGPIQGRKKMIARLGAESLVPIEELLNSALQFGQSHSGGLQSFLAWFESSNDEIKREGISGNNEVRVMTVHGSKGLQAPVVILVDVTSDPTKKPDRSSELLLDNGARLPLLNIKKDEQIDHLEEIVKVQNAREFAEHARLMYVAMTRAEERLIMAGALGRQSKGIAPEHSWYRALEAGMASLGCEWQDEPQWGQVMRYQRDEAVKPSPRIKQKQQEADKPILPEWILTDAPQESRPPKPLVPSQLDDDDYGDAPPSAAMQTAAEKGRLIHAIFERFPSGDIDEAMKQAYAWLLRNNHDKAIINQEILASVQRVVSNPDFADFFGKNARAEVPLAALVGEKVITGRVDRLVIENGRVRVLDFKTGRNVPKSTSMLPVAYTRQMAHYVAALETIFPGSLVEASLLFTHNATLMPLSADILAAHKPASTVH
jgi:ATP-dependent helicase/nuclease subunit A